MVVCVLPWTEKGKRVDDKTYNGWRILRALDRAAAHRVGVAVDLTAALKADGTQHYGPDYNEAVEFLIDEGAIEEDPQTAPIGSGEHPRGHLYWAITVKGRALLRALT
jgi:hypothetical protein